MTYLRRLLLKTMLWALGFGAVAGAYFLVRQAHSLVSNGDL